MLNAAYGNDLEQIIDEKQQALWVHGHTHDSCDYTVGNTWVLCNPRRYDDENARFDSKPVVTVGRGDYFTQKSILSHEHCKRCSGGTFRAWS